MQQCCKDKFYNVNIVCTFVWKYTNMAKSIIIKRDDKVYLESDELNIISFISYGLTAQQVSERMSIGVRTIEAKIAKLKKDLNCKTVTQLCCFCIRYKLIK